MRTGHIEALTKHPQLEHRLASRVTFERLCLSLIRLRRLRLGVSENSEWLAHGVRGRAAEGAGSDGAHNSGCAPNSASALLQLLRLPQAHCATRRSDGASGGTGMAAVHAVGGECARDLRAGSGPGTRQDTRGPGCEKMESMRSCSCEQEKSANTTHAAMPVGATGRALPALQRLEYACICWCERTVTRAGAGASESAGAGVWVDGAGVEFVGSGGSGVGSWEPGSGTDSRKSGLPRCCLVTGD